MGIYRTDTAGKVTYVNARWCELAGMSAAEALNDGWMKTVRADRERVLAEIQAGAKLRARFESEFRFERPDGSTVMVLANAVPELDAAGAVAGYVGAVVDITALRAADRDAREANERFQRIFHAAPLAGTVSTLEDGRVLEANDAFCALLGTTREAVIGRSVWELGTWADPRERAALVEQLHRHDRARDVEVHIRGSGGEIRDFLMSAERIEYQGQDCTLQMGVDITERKQAEVKLQGLTRRLLEVQETERRTVARELHDEVGGVLTAVKLNLQSLRGKRRGDLGEAALADGLALVDGAIQAVRSLSLDLRPALLDDLGLIPALRWYCERQAQRAGIPIELQLEAIDLKAAPQLESACYRIAQEAVNNVLRHAGARRVQVSLRRTDDGFVLEIADDGLGFDAALAHKLGLAGERGGLLGMEERAQLLGGRLSIETAPGAGTRVRAEFSMPEGGFA